MTLAEIIEELEGISGPDAVYCQSSVGENEILVEADKGALIELATHLLKMADKSYFEGMHQHFDEANLLEENSIPIIISRNETGTNH
jgi:hypothetical protein